MSVKLIDNNCFYGYRARRCIDGTQYQDYFPLKKDRKRLTGKAMKAVILTAYNRDSELKALQVVTKKRNREKHYFLPNGQIRGISALKKTEKSGTITPIYQLGIQSEKKGKTVCTSVSVNKRGEQAAWLVIVSKFAEHKCLRKNSKLYKKVMAAKPPAFPV